MNKSTSPKGSPIFLDELSLSSADTDKLSDLTKSSEGDMIITSTPYTFAYDGGTGIFKWTWKTEKQLKTDKMLSEPDNYPLAEALYK